MSNYESNYVFTETTTIKATGPVKDSSKKRRNIPVTNDDKVKETAVTVDEIINPFEEFGIDDSLLFGSESEKEFTEPIVAEPVEEESEEEIPWVNPPAPIEDDVPLFSSDIEREYYHYRQRSMREQENARLAGLESAMMALLPVLDDIVAARNYGELTGPFAAIAQKMEDKLALLGMVRINSNNVPFDPIIHEAVLRRPSENVEEDFVADVLREGYTHGDKTLRAAQVIVSAGKE